MTQTDLQDTQLTSLSDLASQLSTAVSNAVANNNASSLMDQAQTIFDQASAILNSKDANGDYIYSGGKTNTAPLSVTSLSDLASLPDVSKAFTNGDLKKSVTVADGVNVSYGVTASDVATGLMQSLKDLASFDAGSTGDLADANTLSTGQSSYLTSAIASTSTVASNLNAATAANGYVYNQLTDAATQQGTSARCIPGSPPRSRTPTWRPRPPNCR